MLGINLCVFYGWDEKMIFALVLQGAGSALMGRMGKFEQIVRGMNYVSRLGKLFMK